MKYDVVVIGGGSGGLNVAVGACALGAKVALIEKYKLGGDCLNYGCVPSKTLIKSAKVAHLARSSGKYGIDTELKNVDFAKVSKHIQDVIKSIGKQDSPERFREMGINVIFGDPSFKSPSELIINKKTIKFSKCVISTGSYAFIPPIKGLDKVKYLTNMNVFGMKKLPKSLGVIGGGPIGSEMAQSFARLGSKVTVFEGTDHILSREDSDVALELMKVFKDEGVAINANCHVTEVRKKGKLITMIAQDNKGRKIKTDVEALLVATGQRPAVQGLNLEKAGVELTERKAVKVNEYMQTANKKIYACGDVVGSYQFTHVAEHQAKAIIWNLFFPFRKKVDYSIVPWTTYTDPELAHVGLSEAEAKKSNLSYKTYIVQGQDIDRFQAEGYNKGMAKLVADPKGNIKGVTLLLPSAGELIHEFVLAMKKGARAQDISQMIHVYPAMADANKKIVNKFMAEKYLTPRSKKLARFFFRLKK